MDTLKGTPENACDLDAPLLFFPIRHHSPICTKHLLFTMEKYRPDAILIEGPPETNALVPLLGEKDAVAPLCVYFSYQHMPKKKDEEAFRSACYFPLLDFSPELAAVRYGTEHKITTQFIDLPYSELALIERKNRQQESKSAYYDGYYLAQSQFMTSLCERQNCRHYAELWEKMFEIGGLSMDGPEFVHSMRALCHYARIEYPHDMLWASGCIAREEHMAAQIREAQKTHKKVLVVTGAFHTEALEQGVRNEPQHLNVDVGSAQAYLIPFSFAEMGKLPGFASGMPYPAFYQQVHEGLQAGHSAVYGEAVKTFLVQIGIEMRKRKECLSIADEVAAGVQAIGLAALRDKPHQGVYELLDGVRSSYVKGDVGFAGGVLREAETLLCGNKVGSVPTGTTQVPLLLDFREQAKKNGLKIDRALQQEVTLSILSKKAHRRTSILLHRLQYMGIWFCKRRVGPNYRERDTERVREQWVYSMNTWVDTALMEVAHLGGSIREVASTMLARSSAQGKSCGEYSGLLIDAAVMDLTEYIEPLLRTMEEAVYAEGNISSLILAAQNLLFFENFKWLLNLPEVSFAQDILRHVYRKAVGILPFIVTNKEDEDRWLARALIDLYEISWRPEMNAELLLETLHEICQTHETSPCLLGSAVGILHAKGLLSTQGVAMQASAFFAGTGEQAKKAGRFLEGLFLSAWDILFKVDGILKELSALVCALELEEFLALLPDLRLAFSAFTPAQISKLAKLLGRQLQINAADLFGQAVPKGAWELGNLLDGYTQDALVKEGAL